MEKTGAPWKSNPNVDAGTLTQRLVGANGSQKQDSSTVNTGGRVATSQWGSVATGVVLSGQLVGMPGSTGGHSDGSATTSLSGQPPTSKVSPPARSTGAR